MAEAYEVFKQFEYKNNSNLVLQREGPGPLQNEPTGEPESLAGRIFGRMGERAAFDRPPEEVSRKRDMQVPLNKLIRERRKVRRIDELTKELDEGVLDNEDNLGPVAEEESKRDLESSFGVAVVFDEEAEAEADQLLEEEEEGASQEDDDNEQDNEQVETESDSDNEIIEKEMNGGGKKIRSEEEGNLSVSEIGPHWLQKQLAVRGVVSSAELSLKVIPLEKEILSVLSQPIDLQACENAVLDIIGFEQIALARLLLKNRWKVLYMSELGQAQTEEQREAIRAKMATTEGGQSVLEELEARSLRTDKEREFEQEVRREVATLAHSDGLSRRQEEAQEEALQPLKEIDLEAIKFAPDDHFIGVDDVKLPEGTERVSTKEFDEVSVPPRQSPVEGERLAVKDCLPEWAQPAFTTAKVTHLNIVQSRVFETAFNTQRNLLICAPTGAGKTNVAMLTILAAMSRFVRPDGTIDASQFKVIYVSPMKALVAEQVAAFQKRLDCFRNIKVRELTGDVGLSQKQVDETQIIVTTPEKWDVITRKAGERTYTQLVTLMIFDEIHLLHDTRGPVLEALIARTIRQTEVTQKSIRLVGLSATLPNYEDVAVFLRVPLGEQSGLFVFGNHYRPVPLRQTFVGVKTKKSSKRYEVMNNICLEKVKEYAGKSQMLIFTHSRKETARTAKFLRDAMFKDGSITSLFEENSASKEILETEKENVSSLDLKEVLPFGFAIHHAGMQRADRKQVEDLFADRHVQVLVSTATLAWGVNLPAHTVIIKGTQVYAPALGKWTELPPLDVVQMMGRGGRPQYDKTGHGIILTQHSQLQYYVSLTNQQLPIESQMIAQLPDILNSEIVLGSIRHRQDAAQWLVYTYLFVRMCRNPALYGMSREEAEKDKNLAQRRLDLVHAALTLLDSHRLINYEKKSGVIRTTALGRAASHFYLKYPTVATLNKLLSPSLTDIDLFRLFSLVKEFSLVHIRPEEKLELSKAVERVPIPVKGQLSEASTKVNVLLQAYISHLKLDGFALQADMSLVQQNAGRIMRAIFEISLRRSWAVPAKLALHYAKVVDRRMWGSMTPLRQFNVLSAGDIKRIERRDFPWERYYHLKPAELGELVKNPALGKKLHKLVHQFPKLEVACYVCPVAQHVLQFELTISPDFEWNSKCHRSAEHFWIFVENVDGDKLLHVDKFVLTAADMDKEHQVVFTVTLDTPPSPNFFIRLISDRWIAAETVIPVSFRDLVLPAKNAPPSEFLGLQPLPLTALNFPEAEEKLYSSMPDLAATGVFNPIQTQVFAALFSTAENVLLCAPPGSGKTVSAEFAILRMLRTERVPLAVYVAPYEEIVQSKFEFWTERFARRLNLAVARMTGSLASDIALLGNNNIVLARPEHWEAVSRRWKTRKAVQKVRLLILDHIELLNDPVVGSSIEVCGSRTRFVSTALELNTRIVALGASIADAKDVADWLGVTKAANLFNFHPNVRTIPLDLSIHRVDLNDRQARILAIYQPLCHAVKRNGTKPVIIIAPDRRESRLVAIELLLQATAEAAPNRYRHCSEDVIKERIEQSGVGTIREKIMGQTILRGVGIIHEGMRREEMKLVESLYKEGLLQICVITGPMSWSFHHTAHLVIIEDTEIWDNRKQRWTHYSINMMMQFLGHAGRPLEDKQSGCSVLLFCRSSKRDELKRSIFEALPVESNLDLKLADHLLAEIVTGTVNSKQGAVDWLTWTFAYRRLNKNPSFYGLKRATPELLSDYLSELIETAIESLEQAACVKVEEEMSLLPLNLGLVAVFYSLAYTTVELFNKLLTPTSQHKALLTAICAASEIEDSVQIRIGEEVALRTLYERMQLASADSKPSFSDPHLKALVLLSAHIRREHLTTDLQNDLSGLLVQAERFVQGLVDVVCSKGHLTPAIAAMECSQMIVQSSLTNRSSLLQLPNVNEEFVAKAKELGIKEAYDILSVEDDVRDKLFASLDWDNERIEALAEACNNLPVIELELGQEGRAEEAKLEEGEADAKMNDGEEGAVTYTCTRDSPLSLSVNIKRDLDEGSTLPPVTCPFYPVDKVEQWWLLIGEKSTNKVISIRRVTLNKPEQTFKLPMESSLLEEGRTRHSMRLFAICDSYIGCDQELPFILDFST